MKTTKPWTTLSILAVVCACSSDKIETDYCPDDPNKTAPGICGCGVSDFDDAGKLNYSCIESTYSPIDLCPDDPNKTAPGICGCGIPDTDENGIVKTACLEQYGQLDLCPDDPGKTAPGVCGCGVADTDSDEDNTPDCIDECPDDPNKTDKGKCGCNIADFDEDGNEVEFCVDECPDDPNKTEPGICGCGTADDDSDGDGTMDCKDNCDQDSLKTEPGICGCGTPDDDVHMADRDGDTVIDCLDACPDNATKSIKGITDCDSLDSDGDGVNDEDEDCPFNPNIKSKAADGSDPAECNYNDDGIFEIWSAADFERLQTEIDQLINNDDILTGGKFSCEGSDYYSTYNSVYESKAVRCIDNTHLLVCARDSSIPVYFYKNVPVISCDDTSYDYISLTTTNGSVPSTGIPSAFNQYCSTSGFKSICADSQTRYVCRAYNYEISSGYRTEASACPGGCTTTYSGDTPSGSTCNLCTGTYVSSDGDIGQCCYSDYQSTITASGTYKTCISNRIVEIQDSACRMVGDNGMISCAASKNTVVPIIRAKLMRDLDLSEAYKTQTYGGRNIIVPRPLDLYKVDLNGNDHTITATANDPKVRAVVTKPIIGNIIESRVHDLNLDYDLGGQTSASFANWSYRSVIEKVGWTGNANLSGSLLDESYSTFGGLIAAIEETEIAESSVKGSIVSDHTYSMAGLVNQVSNSYIHDSTINLSLLSGRSTVGGAIYRIQNNNIIEKMNVAIERFEYGYDASGLIYNSWGSHKSLDDIKIKLGSVYQNTSGLDFGDDYNFYGLVDTLKNTDITGNIDIQIDSADLASYFYGVGEEVYLKKSINMVLGDIRSSETIRVLAADLNGNIDNSKIRVQRLNTWQRPYNPSIYGLANHLGNSNQPLSAKNVDIHIDSIESEATGTVYAASYSANLSDDSALSVTIDNIKTKGMVYLAGYNPQKLSGTIDVGTIHSGKDIYTVFSILTNYDFDLSNLRIHVKDAKADDGNIYLLGKETKYSGTVDHISILDNIAVRFDRAEAQSIMVIESINSIATHMTGLSNIAIYADAYTHAEKLSPLFANTINAEAGLLELSNFVLNTRMTDCSETDDNGKAICALYRDLNFATTVTSEDALEAENVYVRRWDVEQRLVNPLDAEVTPFGEGDNAFTTEEIVELLGDKWELLSLGDRESGVKVPWLK